MLHVMPFMGPDLEINSIQFYAHLPFSILTKLLFSSVAYLLIALMFHSTTTHDPSGFSHRTNFSDFMLTQHSPWKFSCADGIRKTRYIPKKSIHVFPIQLEISSKWNFTWFLYGLLFLMSVMKLGDDTYVCVWMICRHKLDHFTV